MPRYIPLPWAEAKWTVSLKGVDNGPIEIQCCQVLNKHPHAPRYDNWHCKKVWKVRYLEEQNTTNAKNFDENCRNKKKMATTARRLKLWWHHMSAGRMEFYSSRTYCVILRAAWMVTNHRNRLCATIYVPIQTRSVFRLLTGILLNL